MLTEEGTVKTEKSADSPLRTRNAYLLLMNDRTRFRIPLPRKPTLYTIDGE